MSIVESVESELVRSGRPFFFLTPCCFCSSNSSPIVFVYLDFFKQDLSGAVSFDVIAVPPPRFCNIGAIGRPVTAFFPFLLLIHGVTAFASHLASSRSSLIRSSTTASAEDDDPNDNCLTGIAGLVGADVDSEADISKESSVISFFLAFFLVGVAVGDFAGAVELSGADKL